MASLSRIAAERKGLADMRKPFGVLSTVSRVLPASHFRYVVEANLIGFIGPGLTVDFRSHLDS